MFFHFFLHCNRVCQKSLHFLKIVLDILKRCVNIYTVGEKSMKMTVQIFEPCGRKNCNYCMDIDGDERTIAVTEQKRYNGHWQKEDEEFVDLGTQGLAFLDVKLDVFDKEVYIALFSELLRADGDVKMFHFIPGFLRREKCICNAVEERFGSEETKACCHWFGQNKFEQLQKEHKIYEEDTRAAAIEVLAEAENC